MAFSADNIDEYIKVLLIEDDAIDQLAFTRFVRVSNLPYYYTIAGSLKEAQDALESGTFDVAVVDFYLGDGTALDLLQHITAQHLPFIVATGSGDETVAVQLLQQGAYDYLIKDPERHYLTVLPISNAVTEAVVYNFEAIEIDEQNCITIILLTFGTLDSQF